MATFEYWLSDTIYDNDALILKGYSVISEALSGKVKMIASNN